MVEKTNQKDQRRGGFYWVDKKPYVSVTQVLKAVEKPALHRWMMRKVYYAVIKDPTINEAEALAAPYEASSKAKDRGSTIHSVIEAYKTSGAVVQPMFKDFKGYAEAFYSWLKDNDVEVLDQEKTVVSKVHGYAGTLDLLVKVKGKECWVVDAKTGKGIYPEAYLQLSAYKHALEEEQELKVNEIGVLLLKDNGKYEFAKGTSDFETFLACKRLWEWMNQDLCEEVGYESKEEVN